MPTAPPETTAKPHIFPHHTHITHKPPPSCRQHPETAKPVATAAFASPCLAAHAIAAMNHSSHARRLIPVSCGQLREQHPFSLSRQSLAPPARQTGIPLPFALRPSPFAIRHPARIFSPNRPYPSREPDTAEHPANTCHPEKTAPYRYAGQPVASGASVPDGESFLAGCGGSGACITGWSEWDFSGWFAGCGRERPVCVAPDAWSASAGHADKRMGHSWKGHPIIEALRKSGEIRHRHDVLPCAVTRLVHPPSFRTTGQFRQCICLFRHPENDTFSPSPVPICILQCRLPRKTDSRMVTRNALFFHHAGKT